ncbi:MAG: copper homeostasis protein CutC [Ferruginibacter sp.]|nr:copper homeostasis protein CutC [Cytophagales bacterium]
MASPIQLEICADSIEGALAAAEGGADRVELCTNLSEGGTTPSAASIELTRQRLRIGLHVLIRPRGGDFCYSDLEFEAMKRDIAFARAAGADGIVAGVLRTDGRVDTDRTAALIAVSRPLSFTFHRAFDLTADPHHALRELLTLGVDRLLTSGQSASAPEGADLLTELVDLAGNRLVVMPGGGVNEQTIGLLRMKTGAREFHSSARSVRESPMTYRNPRVAMGANSQEYAWSVVDAGRVRAIRRAAEA